MTTQSHELRDRTAIAAGWYRVKSARVALLVAIGLAALLATPTFAARPSPGQNAISTPDTVHVYHDRFAFGAKQIPLPKGAWQVVGHSFATPADLSGTGYGAVESVALFQVENDAVAGFIVARRNVIPVEGGWGTTSDCGRSDIYEAVTFDDSPDRPFCGFVSYVVTNVSDASDPAWKAAVDMALAHGLGLPTTWLMAGYRISDQSDVMDVRYHFNPELQGFPPAAGRNWADNTWSKSHLTGMDPDQAGVTGTLVGWIPWLIWGDLKAPLPDLPRRLKTVEALSHWLSDMRFPVEEGFSNRLTGVASMPMPWASQFDPDEPSPEAGLRLDLLKNLKDERVLTEDAYDDQKEVVATQAQHVAASVWSAEQLTAVKASTDQMTQIVASLGADLLWTGNITTAGALLTLSTVVDFSRYSALEYMWNTQGPRRLKSLQVADFAPVGTGQ